MLSAIIATLFTMNLHAITPPQEVERFLEDKNNTLSEDGLLPETPPQVLDFARFVVGNWTQVGASFLTLAPDARRQQLIVTAAEFLPPQSYVTFIGKICDLNASGKVTLDTIKTIATAKMFKNGFLAYNYNQTAVAAAITKLEGILAAAEPGKWTGFFADMKSGTAKQAVVTERTKDGEPMPELYNAGPSIQYKQLMRIQ